VDTPASTNYEKFQTGNPIVKGMIDRFYARLRATVDPLHPASLLDAGCGEGETLARLDGALPARIAAIDLSEGAVEFTAQRFSSVEVTRASVYELPFEDEAFDLVVCLELLEHLEEPKGALAELARVSRQHVVVSVPHEPWFRLGSLLRGKYVRGLGNHPEHVNHWNQRSLRALLEPQLEVVSLRGSFPWLISHCHRQRTRSRRQSQGGAQSEGYRTERQPAAAAGEPASAQAGQG
jgi:SAM-dependent methyltransferase